jgi:putative phosphotransacetylase
MTEQEIERLATLIVDALLRERRGQTAAPPASTSDLPVWTGAAQSLDDVAPSSGKASARRSSASTSRPPLLRATTAELTNAARAAAAGRGGTPNVAPVGRTTHRPNAGGSRSLSLDVPIGVSNRHVHLSPAHARSLLGMESPTVLRPISQPGQFAAAETVAIIGPKGRIEKVRIVGPARGETQVEIALSDARVLGLDVPVAASGSLAGSVGGVTLKGPAGTVVLDRGVIVAARHLHLAADDASRWGLANGDRLDVRCGDGPRATTFHAVLVRAGKMYATELHLDADEAFAAGVKTGDRARIIAKASADRPRRRSLVTERDVMRLSSEGAALPANAILTPSARDRARALGLLHDA